MPNDKNYLDCCFWLLPTGITFFFFIMTRQHCFRISAYINVGHNLRSYLKPRTYKIRISVRGISYCLQLKTIFTFCFLFYSIQIFTFDAAKVCFLKSTNNNPNQSRNGIVKCPFKSKSNNLLRNIDESSQF